MDDIRISEQVPFKDFFQGDLSRVICYAIFNCLVSSGVSGSDLVLSISFSSFSLDSQTVARISVMHQRVLFQITYVHVNTTEEINLIQYCRRQTTEEKKKFFFLVVITAKAVENWHETPHGFCLKTIVVGKPYQSLGFNMFQQFKLSLGRLTLNTITEESS